MAEAARDWLDGRDAEGNDDETGIHAARRREDDSIFHVRDILRGLVGVEVEVVVVVEVRSGIGVT